MAKSRFFQLRVSEEEDKLLSELAEDYRLDRTKLILFALDYVRANRPSFMIEPRGKAPALAGATAI